MVAKQRRNVANVAFEWRSNMEWNVVSAVLQYIGKIYNSIEGDLTYHNQESELSVLEFPI